jgi:Heterokaryon incompatibility protein (HET)
VVQDNKDEKFQQCQEMGRIFGNAFLVIAATSAKDSSSGLYSGRHFCDITGMTPVGDAYWFIAKRNFSWDTQPLLLEGQAFQERLLSARVLHVTSTKLVFECREKTFGHEGEIASFGKPEYASMVVSDSLDRISCGWRDLVEKYNAIALLDSSQKLPAISSLAKQVDVRQPSSSYLAGLWSDSLPVDLLWHNALLAQGANRSQPLRAPSWSWAAIDGKIAHPKDISISYIDIIEARTFPTTTDLTGAVSGGYVRVRGEVFTGTTYLETAIAGSRVLKLQGKESFFFADYRGHGTQLGGRFLVDVEEDPWIAAAGGGDLSKRVPLLCLRMGRESTNPGQGSEYALVLQCVDETVKVYMRIGVLIENLRGDKPGCFQTGAVQDTITII